MFLWLNPPFSHIFPPFSGLFSPLLRRHVLMAAAGGAPPSRLRLQELIGAPAEVADLGAQPWQ